LAEAVEAVRSQSPECIGKYFPAEHAAIDWSQDPQWRHKELSQVLAEAGRRNHEVARGPGKLARSARPSG
jgi:hypothetical protein